jgi:hypothetical protein
VDPRNAEVRVLGAADPDVEQGRRYRSLSKAATTPRWPLEGYSNSGTKEDFTWLYRYADGRPG